MFVLVIGAVCVQMNRKPQSCLSEFMEYHSGLYTQHIARVLHNNRFQASCFCASLLSLSFSHCFCFYSGCIASFILPQSCPGWVYSRLPPFTQTSDASSSTSCVSIPSHRHTTECLSVFSSCLDLLAVQDFDECFAKLNVECRVDDGIHSTVEVSQPGDGAVQRRGDAAAGAVGFQHVSQEERQPADDENAC